MPDLVELTHPDLPGEILTVSQKRAAHHVAAGWVPAAPTSGSDPSALADTTTTPNTEE